MTNIFVVYSSRYKSGLRHALILAKILTSKTSTNLIYNVLSSRYQPLHNNKIAMKTRKNFKAQTLSKREMRELNGGGWAGVAVGVLIVTALAAFGNGFVKVISGEEDCGCIPNSNG